MATTNVRSIRDKTASLSDLLISKTIYILAVTETWLRPHYTVACIADISPSGYTFHHRPRSVRRGGGVGFFASQFKVNLHSDPEYSSFESICVDISDSFFSSYFKTPTVSDGLSDHHTVIIDVNVSKSKVEPKHNVFYRTIHKINIAAL